MTIPMMIVGKWRGSAPLRQQAVVQANDPLRPRHEFRVMEREDGEVAVVEIGAEESHRFQTYPGNFKGVVRSVKRQAARQRLSVEKTHAGH